MRLIAKKRRLPEAFLTSSLEGFISFTVVVHRPDIESSVYSDYSSFLTSLSQ